MSVTKDRLEEAHELERLLEETPETEVPGPAGAPRRRVRIPRLAEGWMMLGWIGVMAAIFALEPAPADPNAAVPLWADLLFLAFFGALVAAFAGLSRRSSRGFGASAVAGTLGMGIAAACAATDHHLGMWWAYEMVAFGALTAASIAGLRRS